jgi:signal transduction histidine kinase
MRGRLRTTPPVEAASALRTPVVRRLAALYGRLSLAQRFLSASLLVLLAGMAIVGAWVGGLTADTQLARTAASAGLYVDGVISDDLQVLAHEQQLDGGSTAALDRKLAGTGLGENIVAFKIWLPDGRVVYSPNRALVGRQFPLDRELRQAGTGKLTADVTDLRDPENEFERLRWRRLLQVYAPVREQNQGRVIAVVEFYQLPDQLDREVHSAQLRSWALVAGVMLAMYALMAGIVKRGSDTIRRQQANLARQVDELSHLLVENRRLHERVRQAAGRTTTLNEQVLRRIGADLHDGPAQALGLALLRMDAAGDPGATAQNDGEEVRADNGVIVNAVQDALREIRTIAAGLRLPQLSSLNLGQTAERAVREHQRRTATPIDLQLDLDNESGDATLPVKIALFRSLQEALSNATRHGGGLDVRVQLWVRDGALHLEVRDGGPGFDATQQPREGCLGLAGMREQAELLGGAFGITSTPGAGTVLSLCWPLAETEDE